MLVGTTAGQLGRTESPDDDQGPPPPPELARVLQRRSFATQEEFAGAMRGLATYLVHRADPEDLAAAFDLTILDAAAWQHSMEVLAGWSVADRLGQIEAPALVLVGRHDVLSSPPQGHRIARLLPHAEVAVFEHSGHALFFDEPGRFLAVVGEWLARHDLLPVPTATAR